MDLLIISADGYSINKIINDVTIVPRMGESISVDGVYYVVRDVKFNYEDNIITIKVR